MFKISSVTFLGASVWRVSALRVSEPNLEPISVEPHIFTLNLPDVSGDFESGIAHVIHGLVFNSEEDLPGIFSRTASWVDFRRGYRLVGEVTSFQVAVLSKLYGWLCTANSPLLTLPQSVFPKPIGDYVESVLEARKFDDAYEFLASLDTKSL